MGQVTRGERKVHQENWFEIKKYSIEFGVQR